MKQADVIISGIGPAGASAALYLARANTNVLVFAGMRKPKACGGCLSLKSYQVLGGVFSLAGLAAVPVSRFHLSVDGGKLLDSQSPSVSAYLVARDELDALLYEQCSAAGVEVIDSSVRDVKPLGEGLAVSTTAGAFTAKWYLGADGAQGVSKHKLRLGDTKFLYTCIGSELDCVSGWQHYPAGAVLLELNRRIRGYAWIFSRGDKINAGVMARNGFYASRQELVSIYAGFLARHGLGGPGRWRGAFIPCPDGGPIRVAAGRAAVIGDAAGAADPFLGEGIGQAAQTGLMAAGAILAGDLGRYQTELAAGLWREHASARRLAGLVYRAPRFFQGLARRRPGAVELAWRVLRGELGYDRLWGAVWRRVLGLDGRPAKP